MRWQLIAIGKPKLAYARAGIDEYVGRLGGFAPVELICLKAGPSAEDESARLLERSEGSFRIILDERGAEITSRQFAVKVDQWELASVKTISILIGGADGHTDELRRKADWLWSLGKLTLQHELALLVTAEQVYRAYTIKRGLPYHHD